MLSESAVELILLCYAVADMGIGDKVEQYGILVMGLLIGGGFAFGGIASYAGLTGSHGGSSGNNNNQAQPELPSQNIVSGGFNLSLREQSALGFENDVAFITVMEPANSSVELDRQAIVSEFNNRVYITSVKGDSSSIAARFGYNDFPKAVIISGDARNRRLVPDVTEVDVDRSSIESGVCDTLNDWGSLAAKCSR